RVTWAEAVRYCRWLTQKHGLSLEQQCYDDPKALEPGKDGQPRKWPFHPERPGFRLPTEAEWESACRAGTVTAYRVGSDRDLLGRYGLHLHKHTELGGTLRPNPRGLFDVHGNVWEWCHDWYQGRLTDGTDPVGAADGKNRTLRGGGWDRSAWHCRSA